MPGFLSHYIAGQTALNSATSTIHSVISQYERLYNLGTQGPDIFFYYLPGLLSKRTRKMGEQMHQSNLSAFITHMAKLARKASSKRRDIIFAYTAGMALHYALDTNAHPYVYALTHRDNASKIKNSTNHRKLETAIDTALLKLVSSKAPADYSQWEIINPNQSQMIVAATAASLAIGSVYNRNLTPQDVKQAMRYMVRVTRVMQSRKGRRKKWMGLIENLTIRQPLHSSLIHDQLVKGDFLNQQRKTWKAPWEGFEFCSDSFIDRYKTAVDEGLQATQMLYDYIYGDTPLKELSQKLGNRSLKTGLQV